MDREPGRIHPTKGSSGSFSKEDPEFPQLAKRKDFDRQQHIQKALEAGMTREQAERHADEELAERKDARE